MTSPQNSIKALMPSRDSLVSLGDHYDEIDLSVLFQSPNNALPDFLVEIDSVLTEIKKDRENIEDFVMDLTSRMNEETASLKAALIAKDEQIQQICENHRQKEQSMQLKLNAIQSEVQSMANVNLLSTVYFKDFIRRLAGAVKDGDEFIKTFDCSKNAPSDEANNDSRESAQQIIELNSDVSDDDAVSNGTTIERQVQTVHRPTTAIDQPGPSNIAEDTLMVTEDESSGAEKENVAPEIDAPGIEPVQTGDNKTAKAVKSTICKWCAESVPRKLWSQHKLEVHKISYLKKNSYLKRKNAAEDDLSEDEVSISSVTRPSLVPLRIRAQATVKPKKARKMVTSSPT